MKRKNLLFKAEHRLRKALGLRQSSGPFRLDLAVSAAFSLGGRASDFGFPFGFRPSDIGFKSQSHLTHAIRGLCSLCGVSRISRF